MKRRSFLSALAALPFLPKLLGKQEAQAAASAAAKPTLRVNGTEYPRWVSEEVEGTTTFTIYHPNGAFGESGTSDYQPALDVTALRIYATEKYGPESMLYVCHSTASDMLLNSPSPNVLAT